MEARKLQLETIETQRIAQVEFEKEKAIFKAEQKAMERTKELQVLGFYNIFTVGGTLSNARVRELLLKYSDSDWHLYINELEKIKNSAVEVNENEVVENTCNELLAGVDFEEATQKTSKELLSEIKAFLKIAKHEDLIRIIELLDTL